MLTIKYIDDVKYWVDHNNKVVSKVNPSLDDFPERVSLPRKKVTGEVYDWLIENYGDGYGANTRMNKRFEERMISSDEIGWMCKPRRNQIRFMFKNREDLVYFVLKWA